MKGNIDIEPSKLFISLGKFFDFLCMPLEELFKDCGRYPSVSLLKGMGYHYVKDIIQAREWQLLQIRFFGKKSLHNVKKILLEHNLTLDMELPKEIDYLLDQVGNPINNPIMMHVVFEYIHPYAGDHKGTRYFRSYDWNEAKKVEDGDSDIIKVVKVCNTQLRARQLCLGRLVPHSHPKPKNTCGRMEKVKCKKTKEKSP